MAEEPDLPLFPLGTVALPGEAVPLHLFEERYRALGRRCIDGDEEFGIVLVDEEGPRNVGCALRVEEVVTEHEDGRLDVLCRGTRPFRVDEELHVHLYASARVTWLDPAAEDAEALDEDAAAAVRQAYAALAREAAEKTVEPGDLVGRSAYSLAATIEFDVEAKQQLLELRSENARLHQLLKLLRAALARVEEVGRAKARAASNGVVRLG